MIEIPYPVVLASGSPRRKELLRQILSSFEVLPAQVEEVLPSEGDPCAVATELANKKADEVAKKRHAALVIAGDTVVALPKQNGTFALLSKPIDAEDAVRMVETLSGRTHVVATGVALVWPKGAELLCETSQVTFRKLEVREIRAYVATGEPLDKAGSYGLQGMAAGFVERVEGSVSNVVGLPMERLEEALRRIMERET